MRWELSSEQSDFRAVLSDWLSEVCPPERRREWLDSGDHSAFEKRLFGDGWFGVGTSEELGGEGGGLVELALAAEQFGRFAAPSSTWLASMVALPVVACEPGLARAVLGDCVTTAIACPAGEIPDPTPRAIETGGVITGSIPTVLSAGQSRRLVVATAGSWWMLDPTQPGVAVHGRALTDSSRSVADVDLDSADVVPLRHVADDAAELAARRAAVLVSADSLGAMSAMLDTTVDYVSQRRQFGAPIGSFQAVKHAAAEMLVSVESARSIVYLAAASVEAGHEHAALHAAAAKAQVCASGRAVADSALTLHGAIGYTWEHDLQVFYKRALLNVELFGSPGAWNDRLADRLELVPGGEI